MAIHGSRSPVHATDVRFAETAQTRDQSRRQADRVPRNGQPRAMGACAAQSVGYAGGPALDRCDGFDRCHRPAMVQRRGDSARSCLGSGYDRPARIEITRRVDSRSGVRTDHPRAHTGAAPTIAMQWQPPAPPEDFVLQVGRLFDGVHADYRRHVDVHVRAGRIAVISARGVVPPRGKVIALPDATVIPGLIDVHAHQDSLVGERLGPCLARLRSHDGSRGCRRRARSIATCGDVGDRPHARVRA